jgi:uncharacterized membrane protein
MKKHGPRDERTKRREEPVPDRRSFPAVAILAGLALAYVVVFYGVSHLKYRSFSYGDMDLAAINQTFWSASHGVYVSRGQGEAALFSGHSWIIIFPLLPVYILFRNPLILLFLQALFLGLGAWPVYLIARRRFPPCLSLLFAFSYLVFPAMNYANLFEFHPITFATPLLLFAFFFCEEKRWVSFWIFVVLSLSTREDAAFPVIGLSLFMAVTALVRERDRRLKNLLRAAAVFLLALVWFLCVTRVLPRLLQKPGEATSADLFVGSFYGWLGKSLPEMGKNLAFHPIAVLRSLPFKDAKAAYLLNLLLPVGFLSLLSPSALLMLLVALLEVLFSSRFTHFSIRYQYSSLVTPLVFIAAIRGAENLLSGKAGRTKSARLVVGGWVGLAAIIGTIWFGPLIHLPEGIRAWKTTEEDSLRQSLVEMVPEAAPVVATFAFTPKLSMRPIFFLFYHIYASPTHPDFPPLIPPIQKKAEYALVDFNDWLTFYDFYSPGGDRAVRKFLEEGKWGATEYVNDLVLFRKGTPGDFEPVEAVDRASPASPADREVAPGLVFLGHTASEAEWREHRLLDLSCWFRAAKAVGQELIVNPVFFLDGQAVLEQPLFAPARILPPNRWESGKTYRVRGRILIPKDLPPGSYELRLALELRQPAMTPQGLQWQIRRGWIGGQKNVFSKQAED